MRPKPRLGLLAVAATLAALSAPAMPPVRAFELISPEPETTISLVVGTGQLVRMDEEFSSLFVANPDVADIEVKSPRLLYLTGVGVGETTLFAVDEDDNVLMSAGVRVTHNTSALERGLARVAPGQDVHAITVDQSLVVTGTVASPEAADEVFQVASQFVDDPARVVNRLDVAAPTQVNLQVRIAEISRSIDRQLGIRWGALGIGDGGDLQVGFVGGGVPANGYGTSVSLAGPRLNVDVLLQALAEEGLVTLLAEPNLTARSGETASFLAGGEYPYPVAQDLSVTTVEFKEFGVRLGFTPTVLDEGQISLKVAAEVSDLEFSANSAVPALRARRAETTVDLGSGQSFAIAGLMQNTVSQSIARMPGLGSVPVLGALFRSNAFRRGQTELVILVTPVVVRPTTGRNLRTPVDAYVPPNDFERILLGRFQGSREKVAGVRNGIGRRRLYGQSGFVFE